MSEDSVHIDKASDDRRSLAVQSDAGSIDLTFKKERRPTPRPSPKPRPTPQPRRVYPQPAPAPTPPPARPEGLHAFINARKDLPTDFEDIGGNATDEENAPVESQADAADYGSGGGYYSDGSGADDDNYGSGSDVSVAETQPLPPYNTIREEKEALLLKLYKLRKKNHPVPADVDFHTDIHELRFCVKRIEDEITTGNGVNMARHALIFSVGMIEMLNEQYNPFDLHLHGLSQDVMAQAHTFDDTLEKLVEKYKSRIDAPPELTLLFGLVAIGASTHMRESKKIKTQKLREKAQAYKQGSPASDSKPQTTRKEMSAPSIGLMPGLMPGTLPFPQSSRPVDINETTPASRLPQTPTPVVSRLAPEPVPPPPPSTVPDIDDDDRVSDVITEALNRPLPPGDDDTHSIASGLSSAATSKTRKRMRTKPAPPPTGKIVTI